MRISTNADFKQNPDDFKINQVLDSTPGSKGQHVFLLERPKIKVYRNHFAPQSFGHKNPEKAFQLAAGRLELKKSQLGFIYSVMQLFLFNQILLARVKPGTWDKAIDDDVPMFDGSNSLFYAEASKDPGRNSLKSTWGAVDDLLPEFSLVNGAFAASVMSGLCEV